MARILGGIASSHTPTIGFALDRGKQDDPAWAPIFDAFRPIQAWLTARKPDVLFLICNDHVTSFFFDHYPMFALGIHDSYGVADEGGSPRALPPVRGHSALSHQVHGERAGFNNTEWDHRFLELIEKDPVALTELTHADYARLVGLEGDDVIMWLIMRGALSANVRKFHQTYYLPSMAGIANMAALGS
jgi:hypothetical protein